MDQTVLPVLQINIHDGARTLSRSNTMNSTNEKKLDKKNQKYCAMDRSHNMRDVSRTNMSFVLRIPWKKIEENQLTILMMIIILTMICDIENMLFSKSESVQKRNHHYKILRISHDFEYMMCSAQEPLTFRCEKGRKTAPKTAEIEWIGIIVSHSLSNRNIMGIS